jgi:hypothetical protein
MRNFISIFSYLRRTRREVDNESQVAARFLSHCKIFKTIRWNENTTSVADYVTLNLIASAHYGLILHRGLWLMFLACWVCCVVVPRLVGVKQVEHDNLQSIWDSWDQGAKLINKTDTTPWNREIVSKSKKVTSIEDRTEDAKSRKGSMKLTTYRILIEIPFLSKTTCYKRRQKRKKLEKMDLRERKFLLFPCCASRVSSKKHVLGSRRADLTHHQTFSYSVLTFLLSHSFTHSIVSARSTLR